MFIYALVNVAMPNVVKLIHTKLGVNELLHELTTRKRGSFEPPTPYMIACYTEIFDANGSDRFFIAMNRSQFKFLMDNFYNINGNIEALINLYVEFNKYEQLIVNSLPAPQRKRPLALFIDVHYGGNNANYTDENAKFDEIVDRFGSTMHFDSRSAVPSAMYYEQPNLRQPNHQQTHQQTHQQAEHFPRRAIQVPAPIPMRYPQKNMPLPIIDPITNSPAENTDVSGILLQNLKNVPAISRQGTPVSSKTSSPNNKRRND